MIRDLISAAVGATLLLLTPAAQDVMPKDSDAPPPKVRTLRTQDLDNDLTNQPARVTMQEVLWKPGGASPAHRHPGPVFVYVLEGELETRVGDGPLQRLKAGDTLYEPANALHADTRNPSSSKPARILAIMIHPRAAQQLVIPEEGVQPHAHSH